MSMKKVLSAILVSAMILSTFASCGNEKDDVSSSAPESQSTDSKTDSKEESEKPEEDSNFNAVGYPIVKEPITLKVMGPAANDISTNWEDKEWWKMVTEKTNIHPDFNITKMLDYKQKQNLMFASGEYPDVLWAGACLFPDLEKYGAQQHILAPVGEYLTPELMPNYTSIMNNLKEVLPFAERDITCSDGNIYTYPRSGWLWYEAGGNMYINKTWLDNLGMEIPTTVEELNAALEAFATQDPNGNGEADEVPLNVLYKDQNNGFSNLVGMFGHIDTTNHVIVENDKAVFSGAEDSYRHAMEWAHEMYSKGLIDPEFVAQDLPTYRAKIKDGKTGCFVAYKLSWILGENNLLYGEDYVSIAPPAAEGVTPQWLRLTQSIGTGITVTINNKYPKETARWVDFMYDPIISGQSTGGMLGHGQELNEKGQLIPQKNENDDTAKFTPEEVKSEVLGNSGIWFNTEKEFYQINGKTDWMEEKLKDCEPLKPYFCKDDNFLPNKGSLSAEDSDRRAHLATDLDKYMDEAFMEFIANGVTDEKWEKHLKTLDQIGLKEFLELNQKAIDEYLSR